MIITTTSNNNDYNWLNCSYSAMGIKHDPGGLKYDFERRVEVTMTLIDKELEQLFGVRKIDYDDPETRKFSVVRFFEVVDPDLFFVRKLQRPDDLGSNSGKYINYINSLRELDSV